MRPKSVKVYPYEVKPGDEYTGYVNGNSHCFASITISPEGIPLLWGKNPIKEKIDYFERDMTWEEEDNWYNSAVDMTQNRNQLNLMGIHNDMYSVGDAIHEMWNGWIEYEWKRQLIEIIDENFFIIGITEAPYGCAAINDPLAIVAELDESGERFWCHVPRWVIEEMRESSKNVYEELIKRGN